MMDLTREYYEAVRDCTPEDCGDCILRPATNRACYTVDVDPGKEARMILGLMDERDALRLMRAGRMPREVSIPHSKEQRAMKKTSKTTEKYTVTNAYGISGESNHRTPEAALKAASKREGEGWIVVDQDGNQWGSNGPDAVIVARAESR